MQRDCRFCAIARGESRRASCSTTSGARVPRQPAALSRPLPGDPARAPRDAARPAAGIAGAAVRRGAAAGARRRGRAGAEGSFVAVNNVVSQSVPHLHVHVVPRRRKDGLRGFFWPRTPYRDDAARGRGPERPWARGGQHPLGLTPLKAAAADDGRTPAAGPRSERRTMAVEQALQGSRETESGESFSLQNPRYAEGRAGRRDDPGQARTMVADQGEVKFERPAPAGCPADKSSRPAREST